MTRGPLALLFHTAPRKAGRGETLIALVLALVACSAPARAPDAATDTLAPARVARLRAYIRDAWPRLTRTPADLPRAAPDDKVPHAPGTPWPVYFPATEPPPDLQGIALRPLPANPASITEHGLLYLPRPYVVPGGRFNEMYGWDSYFIVLGLARDNRQLAADMIANFLYEVRHYGGVLNANRSYYLTRSQPPLLSAMVLALPRWQDDRAWLRQARDAIVASYEHWTSPPHLYPELGLSRYFDHGEGPAPEVVAGERDEHGHSHYDRVRAYFRAHRLADELTPEFYRADRAMRESGFDPTGRFGPFGADILHIAPVCLNTLLYRMELDLAEIDTVLRNDADATRWRERARQRQARIETLLWDDSAGQYFDYDTASGRRRPYPFATTFWPLWAGLASPAHARRVRDQLATFERRGGIVTSTTVTGAQWDAPFGWAPLQLFAVDGLRRYGFRDDADRIARAFLSMLVEDFDRRGTLVEKYDVERRTSDVAGRLSFGYKSNEVGFGWTNGVALELLDGLGLL
jgi:alpha,alpha-trehalase